MAPTGPAFGPVFTIFQQILGLSISPPGISCAYGDENATNFSSHFYHFSANARDTSLGVLFGVNIVGGSFRPFWYGFVER